MVCGHARVACIFSIASPLPLPGLRCIVAVSGVMRVIVDAGVALHCLSQYVCVRSLCHVVVVAP